MTLSPPAELVKHVTVILGEKGAAWLDSLPKMIAYLQTELSIDVGEPFAAGEFNFVAPATRADGVPLVLKIAPPYEDGEHLREAEFLRHRDGRGAVRLLDQRIDQRAILLERAIPGRNLAEIFGGAELEAVGPAVDLLRSIAQPPPPHLINVKTVDDWFDGLRRFPTTEFPADYATKALDLYEHIRSNGPALYLHGDYHPANIVDARRSPYLAIDPKGVIGHVGYDIAVFLNNFHWWQETRDDIHERLDIAIRSFSDAFDIDPLDVRQWAFVQTVLGAWWSFEDEREDAKAAVAKADIWNV